MTAGWSWSRSAWSRSPAAAAANGSAKAKSSATPTPPRLPAPARKPRSSLRQLHHGGHGAHGEFISPRCSPCAPWCNWFGSVDALGGEPALGVDGGHAAGAGGGDGLAIDRVGRVARGEHAGDAGLGRSRLDL